MKKVILGVTLLAFIAAPIAVADDQVTVDAELWSRYEYQENLTDFADSLGAANRDNLDFGMYRARINVNVQVSDDIGACIEVQNFGTWGNAFPFETNSQDPNIGTGNIAGLAGTNDVVLYQAFIALDNVGGSNLSFKVGRQEHTLGNELHLGDNDFYGGQYFDGIRGTLDFEEWILDFFYYKVQERSVAPGSLIATGGLNNGGSDDSDLWGVTANFDVAEGHNLEPYFLYKRDGNEGGSLAGPKYNAGTLGILYSHPQGDDNDSMFDWSLEVALQDGEVDLACPGATPDCDLSSSIIEGNFGVSFGEDGAHRVSVGGLIIGDGNDAQDREDFMNLYGDTHRRAGSMDLFSELSSSAIGGGDTFHNLTTYYIDWNWSSGNNSFGAAYHQFLCTEDDPGFCTAAGGEDDLGSEIDLWWEHASGEHVNLQIGLGSFMPGDVFPTGADDDALRGWAMLRFRN